MTSPSSRAEELERGGERVEYLPGWDVKSLSLRKVTKGAALAFRLRPRTVVTSGAGVAVPFCVVARLLGARVIFIETMARVSTASMSGRVLARLAERVLVQWPEMAAVYPGAVVCIPRLLEDVAREPTTPGEGTFLAVGTHNQAFDRLIRLVDEAVGAGRLPTPAAGQTGVSEVAPKHVVASPWLTADEMQEGIAHHRCIVCHAGSGIVSAALRAGRRPILVPRSAAQGEHVDDHQLALASKLASVGLAVVVRDTISASDVAAVEGPLDLPESFTRAPSLLDEVTRSLRG